MCSLMWNEVDNVLTCEDFPSGSMGEQIITW
jgi:hypothetical protein